jgi:dipeptidyl aminopeptidase/acylaminoacyl peptidase
MTKPPSDGPRPGPARRPARDPYGLLPKGVPIAAVASIVGLVVIGFVTLGLTQGQLPITPDGGNAGGPQASDEIPARTPTPSNIVIVPTPEPGIEVGGTLVYAKDGNIWVQTGDKATQLTAPGKDVEDSMPSFSQDGKSVYFVRTRQTDGKWSIDGEVKDYRLDVPQLMRVNVADGDAERLLDGIVDPPGPFKWNGFIREPVVSPDGRYVAMATDLPDPTRSDVTLKLFDLKNDRIKDLGLQQVAPLGHQDPAWRPDGGRLLYVLNDRDGAKGTPRIYAWNPDTEKARPVTGPGYLHPSWSPDGRYIAATKTSAYGTDVVILSGSTGAELVRLTDDGQSWAPTWSPRGDQIAYLHVAGQVIDLRMAQLEGSGPTWTVKDTLDLTTAAGLDGVSRPDWFVPPDELPAETSAPLPQDSPSPS